MSIIDAQDRIAGLILKSFCNELSLQEAGELNKWLRKSVENNQHYQRLTHSKLLQKEVVEFYKSKQKIIQKIRKGITKSKFIPRGKRIATHRKNLQPCILIIKVG